MDIKTNVAKPALVFFVFRNNTFKKKNVIFVGTNGTKIQKNGK